MNRNKKLLFCSVKLIYGYRYVICYALTIYNLQFTIYNSQSTIHNLQFTIYNSQFTIYKLVHSKWKYCQYTL